MRRERRVPRAGSAGDRMARLRNGPGLQNRTNSKEDFGGDHAPGLQALLGPGPTCRLPFAGPSGVAGVGTGLRRLLALSAGPLDLPNCPRSADPGAEGAVALARRCPLPLRALTLLVGVNGPAPAFRRPAGPAAPAAGCCCPATFTAACCTAAFCPAPAGAVRPPFDSATGFCATRRGLAGAGAGAGGSLAGRRACHRPIRGWPGLAGCIALGPPRSLRCWSTEAHGAHFRRCGVCQRRLLRSGLGGRADVVVQSLAQGRSRRSGQRRGGAVCRGNGSSPEALVACLLSAADIQPVPVARLRGRRPSASSQSARRAFSCSAPWHRSAVARTAGKLALPVVANQDPLRLVLKHGRLGRQRPLGGRRLV